MSDNGFYNASGPSSNLIKVYYITYVFGMAGYKGNANLLASSIQYIINVFMTIPALVFIDRWGRRPTLLAGALLMATFMFANAGILATHGTVVPGGVGGVPEESMSLQGSAAKGLIACTYLFVASYAPTWGPVSWIYVSCSLALIRCISTNDCVATRIVPSSRSR